MCKIGWFLLSRSQLTLFADSKDEWDTKEGTDKSMKNELKRHLSILNSEKIKAHNLS